MLCFEKKKFRVKLKGNRKVVYSEGSKKLNFPIEFLAGNDGIVIYEKGAIHWLPPFENEIITNSHKNDIKNNIEKDLAKHNILVEWE